MKKLLLVFISGVLLMSCSKNVEKKRPEMATWPLSEFNLQEGFLKDSTRFKLVGVVSPPVDPTIREMNDHFDKVRAAENINISGEPMNVESHSFANSFANMPTVMSEYYVHYIGITVDSQDTVNILSSIDNHIQKEDLNKVFYYLNADNHLAKVFNNISTSDFKVDSLNLNKKPENKITKVIKPKDYDSSIFFRFPTVIGIVVK